jgi:hypothetical protein
MNGQAIRSLLLALFLLFTRYASTGAQTSASPNLRTLFVDDQRDRGVPLADDAVHTLSPAEAAKLPKHDWPEITERDAERRALAKKLLAQGPTTAEGFYYAAFVFQHGQDPNDYLFAHILATEAISLGYTKAKWISAATLDRYLQSIGQKQVFGTQYLDEKYAYYLQHREDADLKDKIKTLGSQQTLEPYDTQMVPDSIRADFCVPALAVQQKHIQDERAGRSEDIPRVPDCGR